MFLFPRKVSKKIVQSVVSFLILSSPLSSAMAEISFSDIENSYAKQAIQELAAKGVIHGIGNGQFHPAGLVTRQDFAIILAKALGLEANHSSSHAAFSDLPQDHYAFAAVEALAEAGIIAGVGPNQFGTGQALSREQMATILVRALDLDSPGKRSLLTFKDTDKISAWAKDAVGATVELGLMYGAEGNLFDPQGNARREQVALVVARFLEVRGKVEQGPNSHSSSDTSPDLFVLGEIRQQLRENYLYDVQQHILNQNHTPESIVNALAHEYDDPWTGYMNPTEYQEFLEDINPRYAGIGVVMFPDVEGMKVTEVILDSPAARAGLEVTDVITKVDDWILSELPEEERAKPFLGEPGAEVTVVVRREGREFSFSITREEIYQSTVKGSMIDGQLMYILINHFTEETGKDFYQTLGWLQDQADPSTVNGLVIDLRNNPGGFISSAAHILSAFIPKDEVTSVLRYRNGDEEIFWSTNLYDDYPVPIVILTNKETASAAEIVVSAMKEHEKASTLGETTFGKGVGQNNVDLSNGGLLKYTSFQILTPKGNSYNQVGISPDFSLSAMSEETWIDVVRILLSGNHFEMPQIGDLQIIIGPKAYSISSEFIQDTERWDLFKEVVELAAQTQRISISTPNGLQDLTLEQIQAVIAVYQAEMSRLKQDRVDAKALVELIEEEDIRNVLLERLQGIEGIADREKHAALITRIGTTACFDVYTLTRAFLSKMG
ncbi:S41 family peptidase [Ammoniphilus sp. 3BR4]|uniref:S41 family peptidase n=1 Tax=Ammoniphilus sp. 3BR4 TaxID=3158265 RepID=UPI00346649A0